MQMGRIQSSLGKVDYLLHNIYDLFNLLKELGKEKSVIALGYIKSNRWHLVIDKSVQEYEQEKERHREEREKELWGCWDYISIVPKTSSFIYTKDFKGFGEGVDFQDEFIKGFYVSLFHAIRSNNQNKQEKIKITIKDKLERVHILLLRKIDEAIDAKFWTKRGLANIFNADVSSLVVRIIEIIIAAFVGYLIGKI
jgi:hypothetical protein